VPLRPVAGVVRDRPVCLLRFDAHDVAVICLRAYGPVAFLRKGGADRRAQRVEVLLPVDAPEEPLVGGNRRIQRVRAPYALVKGQEKGDDRLRPRQPVCGHPVVRTDHPGLPDGLKAGVVRTADGEDRHLEKTHADGLVGLQLVVLAGVVGLAAVVIVAGEVVVEKVIRKFFQRIFVRGARLKAVCRGVFGEVHGEITDTLPVHRCRPLCLIFERMPSVRQRLADRSG